MTVPRSHPPVWPWRQPPPPAPAQEAGLVASLRPGPRFGPFIGHSHVYTRQPYPGAPAFAYEALGLVEFAFSGPSTANRNHLYPLEGPALFATHGLTTQGLGGLATGQWISSPLIVDPTQLSEQLGLAENWVG